jgi:uncharacterized protein (DUF433 family)
MTDAVQRLLERLQTGWRPVTQEIDREIRQRELVDWNFVPGRRTSPTMRLRGTLTEDIVHVDQRWMTDDVLWIDAGLAWALCADGFYWLEAEVVARQHGVMSGDPVFYGTRVPPMALALEWIAGHTIDQALDNYPTVSPGALQTAIIRAFRLLASNAPKVGEWPPDPMEEALRGVAEAEDTWILQRDPDETGDDYTERCRMLGCDADGKLQLRRWQLVKEDR